VKEIRRRRAPIRSFLPMTSVPGLYRRVLHLIETWKVNRPSGTLQIRVFSSLTVSFSLPMSPPLSPIRFDVGEVLTVDTRCECRLGHGLKSHVAWSSFYHSRFNRGAICQFNFWRVGGFWSRVIYTNESAAIIEVKFDSVRPSSFSARMMLLECQQQRRILRREVTDR